MKITTHYASRITHYVSRFTQHDLAMIMLAMLMMRVLSVITLRVGGYIAETGPDSAYHFQLGRLAAGGAYPFVNYWVEYPPFFPWLSVLAYKLSALMPSWLDQRFWFNLTLHGLIIPFDLANVVLIYHLAKRVNGESLAIKSAWLYAILFVPLFVVLGWFESIALCFTLLALWAILSDRPILAGFAIGLGILVKPYVALIGAVALLIYLRKNKRALLQLVKLIAAGAVTVALGLLPFLITAPQMVLAHLDTLLTLPGWSSPYALIDGVIKHVDPKVADRFDVALAASPLVPSQIPWGVVTLAFGVIYLVVLWRAIKRSSSLRAQSPSAPPLRGQGAAKQSPRDTGIASPASGLLAMTESRSAIGLAALTFIFYLLWSKGFSPQWLLYLIAFLCILLPNFLGTVLIALLEALFVIEWPITFILLNADPRYLTALVIVRTVIIIGLALFFGAAIFTDDDSPRWETAKCWGKLGSIAAVLSIIVLAIAALPLYAAQRYQADPMRQAVELIKDRSTPDRANVLFDRVDTSERLTAFLPGWSSLAALQLGGAADAWSAQKIQSFSAEKPELWYVRDDGADQKREQRQAIDQTLSQSLCKVSQEFSGAAQVSHFVNAQPDRDLNATITFENGLQLDRAQISHTALKPGDPICLEFQWNTTQQLPIDYTVFVHVLDQNGQLVAQSDLQPGGGYAPTSSWPIGQPITDRHGVVLPPTLTPGTYQIVIGLYGPDGVRMKSSTGEDSIVLSTVTIQ
jgi:hypothetical protein